jgi:IS5 family transposase
VLVGARTFLGNPYDGHTLAAQIEPTSIPLEEVGARPKQAIVDLGYRGVDDDNPGIEIIHRGKHKSLTQQQQRHSVTAYS